ncbi:MAG: response regulator [Acidobacteria bacterium]|nr:response regulator [Acidobacteriota bacterium]
MHSEPGVGSTFTIRVPVRVPGPSTGPQLVYSNTARPTAARVLVVEDNKIAQQVVSRILLKAGYEVTFADSGQEGIDWAARGLFDVILMDLQMPGIDGLQATRAIRQLPGGMRTPIIALTANSTDEDREACRSAGMRGFLAKPVHRDELLATVRSLLENPTRI